MQFVGEESHRSRILYRSCDRIVLEELIALICKMRSMFISQRNPIRPIRIRLRPLRHSAWFCSLVTQHHTLLLHCLLHLQELAVVLLLFELHLPSNSGLLLQLLYVRKSFSVLLVLFPALCLCVVLLDCGLFI